MSDFPPTPAFPNGKRGTEGRNFHGRTAFPSRNPQFALHSNFLSKNPPLKEKIPEQAELLNERVN